MTGSCVDCSQKIRDMDASQRIIIYCLGAFGEPVGSDVNLQMIMFLSSMALPETFDGVFTFRQCRKGPYSERIDEDVAVIGSSGYLAGSDLGLSDEGKELYNGIEKLAKEPLKSIILENKEFVSGLTEEELLTFIHAVFPEYIDDSEALNEIEEDRVNSAVSMLEKGKITASQAARVAGMGYCEFEDHLKELKMRWKSRGRSSIPVLVQGS